MSADRRDGDAGFSLVEVLVALTLFTIVAVSSSVALVTSTKVADNNDNRVVAAGLAASQIALSRATAGQPALAGGVSLIPVNGATFKVERFVTLSCAVDHKRVITVKVTWNGVGGPVYADTVRSC